MRELLYEQINEVRRLSEEFYSPKIVQTIEAVACLFVECFRSGGKILTCGNGGSMCDAMHLAEELSGKYRNSRPPLPAFSISDPSYLSCVANDYGYEHVFSRYVEAFIKPGDVLVVFSTSGKSKNVVLAAETAKRIGAPVVAFTGNGGGLLKEYAHYEIRVPYFGHADRIQELHIQAVHAVIMCVESMLFPEPFSAPKT